MGVSESAGSGLGSGGGPPERRSSVIAGRVPYAAGDVWRQGSPRPPSVGRIATCSVPAALWGEVETRQRAPQTLARLVPDVVAVEGRRLLAFEGLPQIADYAEVVSGVERGSGSEPKPKSAANGIGLFGAARNRARWNRSRSNELDSEGRGPVQASDLEAERWVRVGEAIDDAVDRLRTKGWSHIGETGLNRLKGHLWSDVFEEVDKGVGQETVSSQELLKGPAALSAARREGAGEVEGRLGETECCLAFEVPKVIAAAEPRDALRLKSALTFAGVMELYPSQQELKATPLGGVRRRGEGLREKSLAAFALRPNLTEVRFVLRVEPRDSVAFALA